MCQRLSTHDFYMKYLIHWQILSVNTVTPETGAFYYLKISDAKGIQVILMYHYIHRFVQHASADIFLQRYLRHCKRQTQG